MDILPMTKPHKRPCFSSETARKAQAAGVRQRRVNTAYWRKWLVERAPVMPWNLREDMVSRLGPRDVYQLVDRVLAGRP